MVLGWECGYNGGGNQERGTHFVGEIDRVCLRIKENSVNKKRFAFCIILDEKTLFDNGKS